MGLRRWFQRGNSTERALRVRAEEGDPAAAVDLGAHLLNDREDPVEAERWFRLAAETGDAGGIAGLVGCLERQGRRDEAVEWCRRGAEAGQTVAMFNLGVLLRKRGESAEAERWWWRAVDRGLGFACGELAELERERGDLAAAQEWLALAPQCDRLAEEEDRPSVLFWYGAALKDRGDLAGAERWWRRAVEAESWHVLCHLADLERERGDEEAARSWEERAAQHDHPCD
ncbi:tetratricopeptide repeat protein [Actinomadura kijaniata]|uniref:tetratricopeptide repeat protein n=1 Tax=Actinomadura kijaniata TaxID=46161 RepID=UPI0008340145|nr:tetratricopeptide repeat protein [Actinomadura kijaniata]